MPMQHEKSFVSVVVVDGRVADACCRLLLLILATPGAIVKLLGKTVNQHHLT